MSRRKRRVRHALRLEDQIKRAEAARRAGDEAGLGRALALIARLRRLEALRPQEDRLDDEARFYQMSDDEFYAKLAGLSDGLAGTRTEECDPCSVMNAWPGEAS